MKCSCLNQNNFKQTITKTDKYSKKTKSTESFKSYPCILTNGYGPMCTSIVNNVTKGANSDMNNIDFKECGLHISCLNICHLLTKLDEIKYLFSSSKSMDIFGVCETFLSDVIPDTLIQIDNFVHVRRDRKGKHGGGILVYISDKLPFHRRSDLESSDIESIWIEIKYDKRNPFYLSLYIDYLTHNKNGSLIINYTLLKLIQHI